MGEGIKEKIESAREIFRVLENGGAGQVAEIAKRTFCIQDKLAAISA